MQRSTQAASLSVSSSNKLVEFSTKLDQDGIKHCQEDIVDFGETPEGKKVFLEKGKPGKRGSGLAHILERHKDDFANRGIPEEQIPSAVLAALTRGEWVRYQGSKEPRREIYKVSFNDKVHHIAVTVGENGYIVGANPASP